MFYPFLEFPFMLSSIRPGVCSFTIWFIIFEFPYILVSNRPVVCSLTISISIFEFTYIPVSFRFSFSISKCSLTISYPMFESSNILSSIRESEGSLTIWSSIFNIPYIFSILFFITIPEPPPLSILPMTKQNPRVAFLNYNRRFLHNYHNRFFNLLHLIHKFSNDISVFVIFCALPRFIFSPFSYILRPIR